MCTRTKLISFNPTTGGTSEAGYQIIHCPPEAAYQRVLLDWVKSGQEDQMPSPDPRRGLGCLDGPNAWTGGSANSAAAGGGTGRGMRTVYVMETVR